MAGPTAITFDGAAVDGPGPHVVISEAARSGTRVGTLSATDADAGDSFTFTLLDDAGGRFFVAGHELRVSAGAVLDFENDSSYAVTVRVVDSDNNAFEQTISIGLSDDVFHDVTHGTSDGDDITNSASGQQFIVPGAGDDTVHSSGDIVVFSGARADYDITVQEVGGGGGYGYGPPPVTHIHVTDLRPGGPDGADLVIGPSQLRFADGDYRRDQLTGEGPTGVLLDGRHLEIDAYIPEDAAVGTSIGTLGGRDITPGDTFTYVITGILAQPAGQIFLDSVTTFALDGDQLITTEALDFEHYTQYLIHIDVTDALGHTTADTISVTVDGVNEPPEFGLGGIERISEHADTSADITIGTIFVTDDGVGTNNLFLTGADANLFKIVDSGSGPTLVLKAGAALDFESNPTLDITINADDPGIPGSVDSSADFSIAVTFAPINGTPADNLLSGTPFADTINGLAGNDTIFAAGNDRLNGGAGNDDMVAGPGTVFLSGGGGEDTYSLLGSTTSATATISDTTGSDTIDASQARAALVLDLSAGTGHVGQQQIVIDRPAPSAGLEVVLAQDVSGSVQADVVEIRSQIDSIVTAIQSFNASARIGVSSFADKPFFPFGVAAEGDYIYRTDAALTANGSAIAAAYDVLISEFTGAEGGGDAPEGQLEALQQIALRGAEIGWSSSGTAKVVVLMTDSTFHQAPDVQAFFDAFFGPGSLGDPPPRAAPNNNDTVFDLDEEYPSIQQVRELLLAEHIIPVFAIPDLGTGVADQYQALVDLFGFGAVASLAAGSSDVVGAVSEALGFAIDGTTIENVIGTRFDDTIIGNDADNTLAGGGGNDTLDGGAGDDTLAGGRGDDIMTGGAGDDRFSVNSLLDEVHELAGGGNDTVLTEVDFSLSGTELENILASRTAPGLILTGNDANNRIRGGDGDDIITGGIGGDLLAGGDGDDTFVYTSVQDSTRDAGGWDQIAGFLVGHDTIDLHLIDAVSGGSDDAFRFIGAGRFQHAGDLRAVAANNKTVISGDIDGDRVADFQIVLRTELSLSAADFML